MMKYTIGFLGTKRIMSQNQRRIYYPIVDNVEAWERVEDEVLFIALKKLIEQFLNKCNTKKSVPEMGGIPGNMFNRVFEYLFVDTG